MKPTKEQIAKLPKWAQEHIRDLTLERDSEQEAKRRLLEQQEVSPIFVDEWSRTKPYKRFIKSPTKTVSVEYSGIRMDVRLVDEHDGQRPYGIEIKYSAIGDRIGRGVAIVPTGFSAICIQAAGNIN